MHFIPPPHRVVLSLHTEVLACPIAAATSLTDSVDQVSPDLPKGETIGR
jgi:hypothetical protein